MKVLFIQVSSQFFSLFRELKNKNTGIDVSIPTHKEIPGLLGATIEYQVVVVTILQCFKLPKHKETDVVQFMVINEVFIFIFNTLTRPACQHLVNLSR